jgi:dihydrodipicolinate synthase/N-acetylneuraminate lyase
VSIVELEVNGFVERAYNIVAATLMEIVKCHLSGGNKQSQELYNSLLLVFMKIFERNASPLKVYSLTSKSKW